jgi:mannose-1-phosphate guanylyltransferase
MAGGVGSRFWPASTEARPKQFLDILGLGRSLLQLTYDRYRKLGLTAEDIWIITSERYISLVSEQLPDVPTSQIIGEPSRKNTAPAAYLGNKLIKEKVGDAIVIMAPSDHHIEDDATFQKIIGIGQGFLEEVDAMITIGIKPDFPHTGYGYIAYERNGEAPHKVNSFTEKPNLDKATEFLKAGGYLWNAGIFMWHVNTLDQAFVKHSPVIKHTIDQYVVSTDGQVVAESLKLAFDQIQDASIDYEIMERATNVYTIPADFQWSDLGSWKSLYDKSEKDKDENVDLSDQSLLKDASGNLIFVPGKRVIVKGLKDYMIIEENDTLVISPLSSNQDVKLWRNHFEE